MIAASHELFVGPTETLDLTTAVGGNKGATRGNPHFV